MAVLIQRINEGHPSDPTGERSSESGNVFIIVFVAIILFAALIYTFSRGAPQGANTLDSKQASLAASDILSYAQQVERAVNRVYRRGISENDISFENDFVTIYTNANCTEDRCKVFKPDGGSLGWQEPRPDLNGGLPWIFTGANRASGIGVSAESDLMAILPELPDSVCRTINERLGIAFPVTDSDYFVLNAPFTGTFTNAALINGVNGQNAACVTSATSNPGNTQAGENYFYQVLIAR